MQEPILERLATQLERAASVVDSGAAVRKLDEWVAATNR
jgi:anthranilate phosphoribosyltransferase